MTRPLLITDPKPAAKTPSRPKKKAKRYNRNLLRFVLLPVLSLSMTMKLRTSYIVSV